ncbi:hypothetical protein LSH36_481g04037 [Paralvinella palmiformis]|uniref:Uncharacterized protein n=1 Tax=Paralvinella palmiformis TaxID=53620 RepID=A0AAD9MWY2_9ANNE|nr:hypothetical protein LSH36_481g04037 [Paralvinella palmiformis]
MCGKPASAVDNTLDTLSEGGICKPNKYVDYTHQCAVTSYLPTADYCCCVYEQRVFCCRYHYDWNYFRCDEDEDTIHYLTSEPLAIEILVPAIVVPSVALLCFLFYCIKCCCCNDDDDDEDDDRSCDMSSCCRRKRRRRREKSPPIRIDDQYGVLPDNQRSILLPQPIKDTSLVSAMTPEKCRTVLDYAPALDPCRTQPSAPPYDVTALNPPPYNPDLYQSASSGIHSQISYDPRPYVSCGSESVAHDVIYQSAMTHAQIPLPVTRLVDRPLSSARDDSDNENLSGDNR